MERQQYPRFAVKIQATSNSELVRKDGFTCLVALGPLPVYKDGNISSVVLDSLPNCAITDTFQTLVLAGVNDLKGRSPKRPSL